MTWNLSAKSSSTYLRKLSVDNPWTLGDPRIYLGLENLTIGSFGNPTVWGYQNEHPILQSYGFDIGGGYGIDIGGGFNLLIQGNVGGFAYSTPNQASYDIQSNSAANQTEQFLNIGSGYGIDIGGGYKVKIQSSSTGAVWNYQTPN